MFLSVTPKSTLSFGFVTLKHPTAFSAVSSIELDNRTKNNKRHRSNRPSSISYKLFTEASNCLIIEKPKRIRDPIKMLEKLRSEHPMLSPCSCKKQCIQKICEDERQLIWTHYWHLDRLQRREFILRRVDRLPTSCRTKGVSRRNYTLVWTLNDIIVCKVFFLRTLGLTNDEAVITALNKRKSC